MGFVLVSSVTEGNSLCFASPAFNSLLRLYLFIVVLVLFYKTYMNICKGKDHLI